MKNIKDLSVDTKYGQAIVSEMYISELGYLMIKLYFPDNKEFRGYNLMNFMDGLNENGIYLNDCEDIKISLVDK